LGFVTLDGAGRLAAATFRRDACGARDDLAETTAGCFFFTFAGDAGFVFTFADFAGFADFFGWGLATAGVGRRFFFSVFAMLCFLLAAISGIMPYSPPAKSHLY